MEFQINLEILKDEIFQLVTGIILILMIIKLVETSVLITLRIPFQLSPVDTRNKVNIEKPKSLK